MIQLIITQIITCIIQYYIATTEKIKGIFWVTFLFNFSNLLCYAFNKDFSTVCMYVLICIRSFVYVYRDSFKRHKWHFVIPVFFILVQIIVGFNTMTSYWQLITIFAPAYVCYYMWFYDTTQKLRLGNIIGNGCWGVYNTVTGLYIVAVGRLLTVLMNCLAFYKNRRSKNEISGFKVESRSKECT